VRVTNRFYDYDYDYGHWIASLQSAECDVTDLCKAAWPAAE